MKLLVTGGAGFIGSNFLHLLFAERSDWQVINVDLLTYAGNLENLTAIEQWENYRFVKADICDRDTLTFLFEAEKFDAIVNFAAESHVDRSILEPDIFVRTNVTGTHTLLELAKKWKVARFLQVSTDEVYGSLGDEGLFSETTPLAPNSPYSAAKTSADLFVRAYHHTFGMDTITTRCSNNYGPYQFPEKLIPLMIQNALEDKPLPVYGTGMNIRDWLQVEDHCRAILVALEHGKSGEVYNIGGNNEQPNIEIVKRILSILGKPESLIRYVPDRPGHDLRYGIDATKIRTELGWEPRHSFSTGLKATIDWYLSNRTWVQNVLTGNYRAYYDRQYTDRLAAGKP